MSQLGMNILTKLGFDDLVIGFEECGKLLRETWNNPRRMGWYWTAPPEMQGGDNDSAQLVPRASAR